MDKEEEREKKEEGRRTGDKMNNLRKSNLNCLRLS